MPIYPLQDRENTTLPFTADMFLRTMELRKTATTRSKRYSFGQHTCTYFLNDTDILAIKFDVYQIERKMLRDIALDDYKAEGFDAPHEFLDYLAFIHPRKHGLDEKMYIHRFQLMSVSIDYSPTNGASEDTKEWSIHYATQNQERRGSAFYGTLFVPDATKGG